MKQLCLILCLFSLSACSIFKSGGDEIIFDTALGPEAKAQAKELPSDLRGDSDNARHSSEAKVGNNMGAAK